MPNDPQYYYGEILYNSLCKMNPSVSDGDWNNIAEKLQQYYTFAAEAVLDEFFVKKTYIKNDWI